jgi:hypothetical protein
MAHGPREGFGLPQIGHGGGSVTPKAKPNFFFFPVLPLGMAKPPHGPRGELTTLMSNEGDSATPKGKTRRKKNWVLPWGWAATPLWPKATRTIFIFIFIFFKKKMP